jgi:hypothetical protein
MVSDHSLRSHTLQDQAEGIGRASTSKVTGIEEDYHSLEAGGRALLKSRNGGSYFMNCNRSRQDFWAFPIPREGRLLRIQRFVGRRPWRKEWAEL